VFFTANAATSTNNASFVSKRRNCMVAPVPACKKKRHDLSMMPLATKMPDRAYFLMSTR
jgi:hypothetical protein